MPSEDKHKFQYEHNKKMLSTDLMNVDNTAYRDWYITVLFYGAIHLVEECLSKNSLHSKNHEDRIKRITRIDSLRSIAQEYNTLYMQSRRARYDCVKFTINDLKESEACLEKIESVLKKTS